MRRALFGTDVDADADADASTLSLSQSTSSAPKAFRASRFLRRQLVGRTGLLSSVEECWEGLPATTLVIRADGGGRGVGGGYSLSRHEAMATSVTLSSGSYIHIYIYMS